MPIVITSSSPFKDQYNAGTTNVFQGNSGDRLFAEIDFYYENSIDASGSPSTQLDFVQATTFQFPAFAGNAVIDLNAYALSLTTVNELLTKEITIGTTKAAYNGPHTVVAINGRLVCLDIAYTGGGGNSFQNGNFHVSSQITAFEHQYSYDRVNDNDFTGALSNGLTQKFVSNNSTVLDHTNVAPVNLEFGTVGSYQIGSCTIQGANLGIVGRQGFKVIQELIIIPIEEGDNPALFINYTNAFKFRLIPKEFFNSNPFQQGANSIPFTSGVVDSGQIKVGLLDTNLGSGTNYSVSNLVIERTSDAKNSGIPIVQEKFTVTADIDNTVDSPFSDLNTQVQVAIENIPDTLTSSTQGYVDRFVNDRALSTLGAGAIGGESTGDAASITNYTATFVSADQISISFDVDFTANAETQINAQSVPNFTITCSTQNHTKTYVNTDRVNLTVFNGQGINVLLEDPVVVDSNKYVTHTFPSVFDGIDTIDGFPMQDIVATTTFSIDWTSRPGLRLNRIIQSIVLKNSVSGDEIELEESAIPVSAFPLINGEYPDTGNIVSGTNQTINKGFKIPIDEIRNLIQMANLNIAGPNPISFVLAFPFFVRWEYYTQLLVNPIPSDLIDSGEPFDGINHFIHRIDDVADWDIFYRMEFQSAEQGQNFVQTFDNQITTTDYNAHPEVTARRILTFKEDKVTSLLNAGIKYVESTEKTLVKAEWDMSSAPVSIGDFEIAFFMEVFEEGGPTQVQRISSINDKLASSWFTDLGLGDGKIVKSIDGLKAVGEAFIDNVQLQNADKYRIYAHIYLPSDSSEDLITESGEDFLTEDGEVMKIE